MGDRVWISDYAHRSHDEQGSGAVDGQGRGQHPLCAWVALADVFDRSEGMAIEYAGEVKVDSEETNL